MIRAWAIVWILSMPCYGQDDWLGGDALSHSIDLYAGTGSDELDSFGLNVSLPSFSFSQIDLSWSQQSSGLADNEAQQKTHIAALSWQTDSLQSWSYKFTLSNAETEDQFKSNSLSGTIYWNFAPAWQMAFGLSAAHYEYNLLYLQLDFDGLQQQSFNFDTQSQKAFLELAYYARDWGIRLYGSYGNHEEPNLQGIQSELLDEPTSELELRLLSHFFNRLVDNFEDRGFSPEESTNRARLIFLAGKDRLLEKASIWANRYMRMEQWLSQHALNNANAQQFNLSKYDLSVQVFFDLLGLSWELSATRLESYYLQSQYDQAHLGLGYAFSPSVNGFFNYSTSLDDEFEVYQLGLGFKW